MSEDRLTRKQRQARTRISLIRSAAGVFARRGLQRGTIDEVAADAGFTKGAFYANFSSKEELFLAMLDEGFAARLRQVRELSASDPGIDRSEIVKRARVEGEDYAHHLAADPDWQRLFFEFVVHATREEAFRRELVRRYDGLRTQVAEVFAQRAADLGVRPTVDVESLARMIFAMANGFALERLLEPEEASEESYGAMLAIFFTGLRALGAGADSAVAGERGEAAATSGRGETAATSGRGETAATSGRGETAATSGRGEAAATSGRGETAATGGRGETAATGGRGETAATGGRGETAATDHAANSQFG